jgi:pyochelin biosynthetic protein PchC
MSGWIRDFRIADKSETRPRVRLFCFPHAGGAASYYYSLSKALPSDIQVLAIQYPGRQERFREPCITNLTDLSRSIVSELVDLTQETPFAFFGHSMGSVVACEVARSLEDVGHPVSELFASGRCAPSFPSRAHHEPLHSMSSETLLAVLLEESGMQAEILRQMLHDQDFIDLILPAIRADFQAIETYSYQPGQPLSCPISVLIGDNDLNVNRDGAGAWAAHTTASCRVHLFPGGHFYLDDEAVLGDIAKLITEKMSRLQPVRESSD